jgi:cell division protein FtsI/penicillin-binding protein 2
VAFRLIVFGAAASFWLLLILVQLWDLQVRQSGRLTQKALRQQEGVIEIGAARGSIYDRFGKELALSTPVESIGVFPDKVRDPELAASLLAEILDLNAGETRRKLQGDRFQWVKRLAEPGEAERVRNLDLPGIHFERENKRYYPKGSVASHILGAVGIDHEGLAGLEQSFEDRLRGRSGRRLVQLDALRNRYASV